MVEGERQPEAIQEKCQYGNCNRWGLVKAVLDDASKMDVCGEHFLQLIDDAVLDHTESPYLPPENFTDEFRTRYRETLKKWLDEPDSKP